MTPERVDQKGLIGHSPLIDLFQTVAERLAAENHSIRRELEQYLARDTTRQSKVRGSFASRRHRTGSAASPSKAVDGALGGDNGGRDDQREAVSRGASEGALQAQVGTLLLQSTKSNRKSSGQSWFARGQPTNRREPLQKTPTVPSVDRENLRFICRRSASFFPFGVD